MEKAKNKREKLSLFQEISKYFSVKGFLTGKSDVERRIYDGITFRGPNLWVLVFAILIASLGLNMNSTAVIIGAMLISPLMGPIIGLGFSVGTNDFELLKRSFKNYLVATFISLLTATVYFMITPYHGAQSELLARTSPTIYDVLIALCGGAAGIVALCAKDKGNILPGVAIATALMPPLCTAGFGIASFNLKYFLGAFYLYFINTVFIALATYLGVRAMKFRSKVDLESKSYQRVRRSIMIIVIATMVPAAIMTVTIINDSIFNSNVDNFIANELNFSGTQIISHKTDRKKKVLRVASVGKEISREQIETASEKLENYHMKDYLLRVIQGNLSDSLMSIKGEISSIASSKDELNRTINLQNSEIAQLKDKLEGYTKYETLTKQVIVELKSFYPDIEALSLSESVESGLDTNSINRFVSATVKFSPQSNHLSDSDLSKLENYIRSRVQADSVVVTVR